VLSRDDHHQGIHTDHLASYAVVGEGVCVGGRDGDNFDGFGSGRSGGDAVASDGVTDQWITTLRVICSIGVLQWTFAFSCSQIDLLESFALDICGSAGAIAFEGDWIEVDVGTAIRG
jgi:hypothetical protein